jgi:hypothetical protein
VDAELLSPRRALRVQSRVAGIGVAFTLPYRFDTTTVFRGVLKGAAWLEAVVVVGIVYSLLVSGNLIAAAQLLLIGLVAGGFAVVIFRHTEGSVGTITRDGVTVERAPAILGARFPGPVGRFTLSQFAKVRAEEAFGPIGTSSSGGPSQSRGSRMTFSSL